MTVLLVLVLVLILGFYEDFEGDDEDEQEEDTLIAEFSGRFFSDFKNKMAGDVRFWRPLAHVVL